MAAFGNTSGSTYQLSELLGLLVVVLASYDSYWYYNWYYLHIMTVTGTFSGSTNMLWQLLGQLVLVLLCVDSYWDY